jgi:diguanylate cyclase (GGDEF)-like protein
MAISGADQAGGHAGGQGAASAHHRRLPPVNAVFGVTGAAIAIAAAAGVFGADEPLAMLGIGVATFVALVVATVVYRPSRTWPWVSICAALALFFAGGIARAQLHTMGNLTATRALWPDLVVMPGYLLLGAGLIGFTLRRGRSPHLSGIVLDGLIAALALAAIAWVFLVQALLRRHGVPLPVTLVLVVYPSLSIFMVVVTMRVVFDPARELVPAFWSLLCGMSWMFVGDVVYMFADMNLLHVPQRLIDLPYELAYLGAGSCALHVSMRKLTELDAQRRRPPSRLRIAVVAVALLIPALLTLPDRATTLGDRVTFCALMVAMTATAVLRIVQALRTAESSEARLVFQANHDSLTGLPNRRMMEQHLSRLLDRSAIDETHVAVLYLDLDRFKLINDTLGHSHGDELLVEVAERLGANVRPTDLVTRIGGDEFMIVLGDVVGVSQALELANRLRSCLRVPFVVHGKTFYVSASIGLAFASGDDPTATAEALVRDADTAMYQAKDAGRDSVAVFDESMRDRMAERVELERDLHFALQLQQLHLVYQPIVRLPRGQVVGMEALVRWSHPTQGVIPPVKFIPLAEEGGLIGAIGDWVLDTAVGQFAAWRRHMPEMTDLYVSVNLSGAQLHVDIVERVAEVLRVHRLEGESLCLELTESVVMEDPAAAASILVGLRQLGVRIAIDDFGSEYSSLAYLKRFPTTILKIDKSFVDSLSKPDTADATLIATIVAMAQALGIGTIAEGVETPVQAARLAELGCDVVQGYLFSRPVGADRLPEVVAALSAQRLQIVTS